MNARLRGYQQLPLPQGAAHDAWLFDLTAPAALEFPWPHSAAGAWVRMTMPRTGPRRVSRVLARLADYAVRMQGDLHDEFRAPRSTAPQDLAELVLATALMEAGSPFVVMNISPTGRVIVFHRCRAVAGSWHTHASGRRGSVPDGCLYHIDSEGQICQPEGFCHG